jgi:hypothetical protein
MSAPLALEPVTCSSCYGEGFVEEESWDGNPEHGPTYAKVDCDWCEGEGRVEPPSIPTEEEIWRLQDRADELIRGFRCTDCGSSRCSQGRKPVSRGGKNCAACRKLARRWSKAHSQALEEAKRGLIGAEHFDTNERHARLLLALKVAKAAHFEAVILAHRMAMPAEVEVVA